MLITTKFFVGGMILAILQSCFGQQAGTKSAPPTEKNAHSVMATTQQPSPTPQPTQRIERSGFTIVQFPDEPIVLLSAELIQADQPRRAELLLEIQNVSAKTARLILYGMGPSLLCSEFMYSPVPSPYIGYGDWAVGEHHVPGMPTAPALKPNEKATIRVSKDKFLRDLLKPGMYKSCPDGHKQPELMLQDVYFADGTLWKPNM